MSTHLRPKSASAKKLGTLAWTGLAVFCLCQYAAVRVITITERIRRPPLDFISFSFGAVNSDFGFNDSCHPWDCLLRCCGNWTGSVGILSTKANGDPLEKTRAVPWAIPWRRMVNPYAGCGSCAVKLTIARLGPTLVISKMQTASAPSLPLISVMNLLGLNPKVRDIAVRIFGSMDLINFEVRSLSRWPYLQAIGLPPGPNNISLWPLIKKSGREASRGDIKPTNRFNFAYVFVSNRPVRLNVAFKAVRNGNDSISVKPNKNSASEARQRARSKPIQNICECVTMARDRWITSWTKKVR